MAHLKAPETRDDVQQRKTWKLTLIRQLHERGFERQEILNLFCFIRFIRFIDWVLAMM